jgi:hypothetical protein
MTARFFADGSSAAATSLWGRSGRGAMRIAQVARRVWSAMVTASKVARGTIRIVNERQLGDAPQGAPSFPIRKRL